jgi:hypothetical protein
LMASPDSLDAADARLAEPSLATGPCRLPRRMPDAPDLAAGAVGADRVQKGSSVCQAWGASVAHARPGTVMLGRQCRPRLSSLAVRLLPHRDVRAAVSSEWFLCMSRAGVARPGGTVADLSPVAMISALQLAEHDRPSSARSPGVAATTGATRSPSQ